MNTRHLTTIRSWVGRSYANLRCWDLIVEAFALRDIKLEGDYFAALPRFRTVFEPEPWDVVPVANHQLGIVNHVGLFLGDGEYIHSIEGAGVVIHPLTREPFYERIARARDGRKGFLRLR